MKLTSLFAVLVLIALTVASGLVHGRLSRRWGMSGELKLAGKQLEALPTRIGPWEMQSSSDLDEYAQTVLECTGSINRVYVHSNTGRRVSVALLLGPAGPIATHSPEICYSSRDMKVLDERRQVTVQTQGQPDPQEFWALTFQPSDQAGDLLRIWYGWNDGTKWSAPNDARLAFFGKPLLYKVQAAALVPVDTDLKKDDPCRQFLETFLTAVEPSLLSRR